MHCRFFYNIGGSNNPQNNSKAYFFTSEMRR